MCVQAHGVGPWQINGLALACAAPAGRMKQRCWRSSTNLVAGASRSLAACTVRGVPRPQFRRPLNFVKASHASSKLLASCDLELLEIAAVRPRTTSFSFEFPAPAIAIPETLFSPQTLGAEHIPAAAVKINRQTPCAFWPRTPTTESEAADTPVTSHTQSVAAMPMPMLFDDRFRLRRPLSNALYGPVGLYEDAHKTNELVAVKQVSLARAVAALRLNPNMDNPWSEHRVVSRLMALPPHANVVRFRGEFLQAHDTWCVVMEFCPGGDLWELLERAPMNRLPESEACQLFLQCARGVQFLHTNGIAHRDLSLENVFYCRDVCKIGDFGLSTDAPLRGSGEVVGKAYYMAPEVVNQEAYDAFAADMWSLGIMLFIMLTGSPLTSNAAHDNKAFAAFCELGVAKVIASWGLSDRISPATITLLGKLLNVNPADRPTADELLELLA